MTDLELFKQHLKNNDIEYDEHDVQWPSRDEPEYIDAVEVEFFNDGKRTFSYIFKKAEGTIYDCECWEITQEEDKDV